MLLRLRIFSAFVLICVCSNSMAVTGSTTFTVGEGAAGPGFSIDGCAGNNFGSVATPTLPDGKKICALYEWDYYPINDNILHLVIEGFTSDPGINYFNSLTVSCGVTYSSVAYGYDAASGQAEWGMDFGSLVCIGFDPAGSTESLTIQ